MYITLKNKSKLFLISLLAFLFTAMQVVGYQISMFYQTTFHQSAFFQSIGILTPGQALLFFLIALPIWCIIIYFIFTFLEKLPTCKTYYSDKFSHFIWPVTAIFLFLCWIPCFLAGYPGFYNYDAFNQVPQALYEEVPYSAHHPLLHTLVMGKIIAFGYHFGGDVSLNDGIALHSIFQMTFCAVVFGYCIAYIFKITNRRLLTALALCYYGFFPPIAMFAMSTTKDVIFSALLQLFIIFLYEMFRDLPTTLSSRPKILRLIVTAVLMCLFRKNGIYIIIGLLPFTLYFAKNYWKKILLILCCTTFSYFILSKGLLVALHATESSPEEAFSVPIQQLARVYCEHGEAAFDPEELTLIYEGISTEALLDYNPFLSDHVKNNFDFDVVLDNRSDYILLWLRKGLQYPKEYLNSFLDNTYQAWYPGTSIYEQPGSTETYYFGMNMCAGGERISKAPKLLPFYEQIATGFSYQKIPVLRLFFSIGTMFWVALFVLFYGINHKNRALVIAMLTALLCCCTALLGPIALVRYYLVLFYGFPVSIGFLMHKQA